MTSDLTASTNDRFAPEPAVPQPLIGFVAGFEFTPIRWDIVAVYSRTAFAAPAPQGGSLRAGGMGKPSRTQTSDQRGDLRHVHVSNSIEIAIDFSFVGMQRGP